MRKSRLRAPRDCKVAVQTVILLPHQPPLLIADPSTELSAVSICGRSLIMSALNTSFTDDVLVAQFVHDDLRDLSHVFQTGTELLDACSAARGRMLLDFSNVKFITSEMLGQLFVLANRCKGNGVVLQGCCADGDIRLILETVRFVDVVPIYDDVASAMAAFEDNEAELGNSQEFSVHPDVLAKEAAEGDIDAEFDLGVCYEQGTGVEQDMVEAMRRFRRAADAGHADAQYKLGAAYAYGIQVPQDYGKAIQWYQRAAEQGQADSQYALGMTYCYGIGVEPDTGTATQWYEKASAQGHRRATEELARLGAIS